MRLRPVSLAIASLLAFVGAFSSAELKRLDAAVDVPVAEAAGLYGGSYSPCGHNTAALSEAWCSTLCCIIYIPYNKDWGGLKGTLDFCGDDIRACGGYPITHTGCSN